MKNLIFILVLVSNAAHADDLYKCVKDGRSSYQDRPCDKSSSIVEKMKDLVGESMAGCYEVNFSGSASGSSIERMEIKSASSGGFEVVSPDKSEKWGFHMKRATPEEVQFVSQRFRLDLRQGVSVKYGAKDPSTNQPPIGFYKGKDEKGNDVTLAFFFLANGIAKKIPCR